jgi:hypothetical protein
MVRIAKRWFIIIPDEQAKIENRNIGSRNRILYFLKISGF